MILEPLFEQFLNKSAISVMARATIEHALSASALDKLFDRTAQSGYTRELLFSSLVDLMCLVVSGKALHVQSAFQQIRDQIPVTLKSVYEKLQRLEPQVAAELVRHVAGRSQGLIEALGGTCQSLLPNYRVRILDGNHLAATQKRLKVTRQHKAGPMPGQCLAVLDPALAVITDVIPCEDAHAQERALLEQVLPLVRAGDVWIADRNFCTADFLCSLQQEQACFVLRRHSNLTVQPQKEFGPEVETETGWASEQPVWVCRDGEGLLQTRLVRLRLKKPTEDGDEEILLLSNLPGEAADAAKVSGLYLKRWKVEGAFYELTMTLQCEVNTLGYPKAALFAFCVAVSAYNVLAVVKAALRAVHGEERVEKEVSGYYVALEWSLVYAGMMIALPPEGWKVFGEMATQELAGYLREWASKVNMLKIKKAPPRKPTKNKTKRDKDASPHLSTARLLEEAKSEGKKRSEKRNKSL